MASEFYRARGRVVPEEAGMEVKSSGQACVRDFGHNVKAVQLHWRISAGIRHDPICSLRKSPGCSVQSGLVTPERAQVHHLGSFCNRAGERRRGVEGTGHRK